MVFTDFDCPDEWREPCRYKWTLFIIPANRMIKQEKQFSRFRPLLEYDNCTLMMQVSHRRMRVRSMVVEKVDQRTWTIKDKCGNGSEQYDSEDLRQTQIRFWSPGRWTVTCDFSRSDGCNACRQTDHHRWQNVSKIGVTIRWSNLYRSQIQHGMRSHVPGLWLTGRFDLNLPRGRRAAWARTWCDCRW